MTEESVIDSYRLANEKGLEWYPKLWVDVVANLLNVAKSLGWDVSDPKLKLLITHMAITVLYMFRPSEAHKKALGK